nr:unnamed protein product [Callosobruchus analis]
MKLAHLNVRSLTGKVHQLRDVILDQRYDIVGISETWLSPAISTDILNIDFYRFIRKDRSQRGGGIGMYIKNNISFTIILTNDNIEQPWIKIKQYSGGVGCLYKPPSANSFDFIDELETVIGNLVTMTDEVIFMGDLNIDLLNTQSRYTAMLNNLLDSVGLSQIITESTRITLTTQTLIDLKCISNSEAVISSGITSVNAISDHELVYCTLFTNNQSTPVVHRYRDYRNLNINYLTSELKSIPWRVLYDLDDVDEKIEFLNCGLLALQNRHAKVIFQVT